MNKTNIRGYQLFSILISVRMFSVICSADISNAEQMAGAALSLIFQYLAAIPMLFLYKNENFSPKTDMFLGNFGKILYIIFFVIWGSQSFSGLWEVTKSVYFPIDSSFMGALILAAVCVYTASFGIKAVSRVSGFMTGLIIISLAVIAIGAIPKMELANFTPEGSIAGIIKYAVRDFSRSGELVMLFMLMQFTDQNRKKGISAFFIGKFVLVETVSLIEITVLGNIMNITSFPFFTAGAFSQPFSIQRADSLYMIMFTMLCVLTATLQIVLSVLFIDQLLPKLRYKTLFAAVLMLLVSSGVSWLGLDLTPVTGIMIVLLAAVFPTVMYTRRKINENKTADIRAHNTDNA